MIIKFNLLPKKEVVKIEEKKEEYRFLRILFIIFIVVIFTIIGEGIRLQYSLNNLQKEREKKQKQLVEYKTIAEQVKAMEREIEEIKKRILTIVDLKKRQGDMLQKIETIITNIEKNKIVFTQLALDSSRAEITGISSDLKDIAEYLKNLENQKEFIKEVALNETNKKEAYIEFKAGVIF